MKKSRISIFSSGSGTNAEKIAHYFHQHEQIEIVSVYCNNPKAGVVEKMEAQDVTVNLFTNEDFFTGKKILTQLEKEAIDYIVLAGFLRKIPAAILANYPRHIINIHPSLLPKYGGKGMYGRKVHQAVLENNETETGITIHLVNEVYDEGEILAQFKTNLNSNETVESIQQKVQKLEHSHFAAVIEDFILVRDLSA